MLRVSRDSRLIGGMIDGATEGNAWTTHVL